MSELIEIDGSMGEGGGQILRMSLALASVLEVPIRVYNIRKRRPRPGLMPQHLNVVRILSQITEADVLGANIGSRDVVFKPKRIKGGSYRVDIGTAGSISLILQAILPAAVFADDEVEMEVIGGTDTFWAPPIDYMRFVFIPILRKMGADIEIELIKRGHYPRGGGRVRIHVNPSEKLKAIKITERGEIKSIKGISHCVRLPPHVAERQARAAEEFIRKNGFENLDIDIELEYYERGKDPHIGPGSGIVLWTLSDGDSILGSDALGERGKPAERVGSECAEKLIKHIRSGAALDSHMGDMLIIWMLIADGKSEISTSELTMHTKTCIELSKIFADTKIEVSGGIGKPSKITVEGIGISKV
ncbi:MAG: RNA 3'-terminal phosphate cyclase [Candidatus Asgardarchaeia archaeon]